MASPGSVKERHAQLYAAYEQYHDTSSEIQEELLEKVLPSITEDRSLDDADTEALRAFLSDGETVFRFLRKAGFDKAGAKTLLTRTLTWRLDFSMDDPPNKHMCSFYISEPLLTYVPNLFDFLGRPCYILNLRHVLRTEDGALDSLRKFIAFAWESARRRLKVLSDESDIPHLQMVLLVDLDGATMSNMEIELLPYMMDLLKNNFPGMVGAIYIINYNLLYAGMWAIAKRILPQVVLDRIMFPTKEQLLEFFDPDCLPAEYGGNNDSPERCQITEGPDFFEELSIPESPRSIHGPEDRPSAPGLSDRPSSVSLASSREQSCNPPDPQSIKIAMQHAGSSGIRTNCQKIRSRNLSRASLSSAITGATPEPSSHPFSDGSLSRLSSEKSVDGYMSPYNPRNPYFGYPLSRWNNSLPSYGSDSRRRKRDLLKTLIYLLLRRCLALRRAMYNFLSFLADTSPPAEGEDRATTFLSHYRKPLKVCMWLAFFLMVRTPGFYRLSRLPRRAWMNFRDR